MFKPIVYILFAILYTCPVYGYTITVQEKLIGFINKTSVIDNIESYKIKNNYIHVKIKEKGKVIPYSFQCTNVVRITEDNGDNISFNCDDSKSETSTQLNNSVIKKKEKRKKIDLDQENRSDNISQIQDAMIREGHFQRIDLNKRNIRVEDDVVVIEVNCRRTNIQSTLIKSFWLCGYVMAQNNLFFPEIRVILHISRRDNILITSVSGPDILELGSHKISDYQFNKDFLNKINVYTQ